MMFLAISFLIFIGFSPLVNLTLKASFSMIEKSVAKSKNSSIKLSGIDMVFPNILFGSSVRPIMLFRDLLIFSFPSRSEEHTSELQSRPHLVCRLLLEKKNKPTRPHHYYRDHSLHH